MKIAEDYQTIYEQAKQQKNLMLTLQRKLERDETRPHFHKSKAVGEHCVSPDMKIEIYERP